MPGTMPLVESVTCARRERDSLGIEQNAHGGHRRVIVEQRLALAHQHDVRLRRELLAIFLERDQDLPHDFARREIADQPQLRGEAEMAIDGASRLRRNANRLAPFARHEDGLDLRGLFIFAAADREKIADRSIHGRKPADDARRRDASAFAGARRSRSAAGRFVIAANSKRRSAYSA